MGQPKPLLLIGDEPCVVRCARVFGDIGARSLVVLGVGAEQIAPLLDEAAVPHVLNRDHRRGMYSSVIARVAASLGRALQETGACLNLRLLEAAALLHDVARGQPEHAEAGAALLSAARLPRVAAVVAGHMELPGPLPAVPGEVELLYLADKLVRKKRVVPLERRLEETLRRLDGDETAREAARCRLEVAACLAADVERSAGRPLARLIA